MKKNNKDLLIKYSLIITLSFILIIAVLVTGLNLYYRNSDSDSLAITQSATDSARGPASISNEIPRLGISLATPFITGLFTSLVALFTFVLGTNRIDNKKELVEFHKKYIEIKNEFSSCLIAMNFHNNDAAKKRENLQRFAFLFSKSINLLFEECLSANDNALVDQKMKEKDGWINSTCNELFTILRSIETFYGLETDSLRKDFELGVYSQFKDRLVLKTESLVPEPKNGEPVVKFSDRFTKIKFEVLKSISETNFLEPDPNKQLDQLQKLSEQFADAAETFTKEYRRLSPMKTSTSEQSQLEKFFRKKLESSGSKENPDFAEEIFQLQKIYQDKFAGIKIAS